MMLVPHRKYVYGPPRSVTGTAFLLYVDIVRASLETHIWASTACYTDGFPFIHAYDVRTS
jgi:hypothetical protein